jgi:hypothetical protein
MLIDGTASDPGAVTGTNIENLAGTDNVYTFLVGGTTNAPVGNPAAASQYIYIGRSLSTSAPTASGSNASGDDFYWRFYEFTDCSTGTTLATVIENATAGSFVNGAATSATCADTGVTTIGVDRLACNFGAINDDLSGIAVFAGATGGTWAHFQLFEDSTGTDGTVFFEDAAMPTAGTIDGGTDAITSLAWGVIGFALIGTTVVSSAASLVLPNRTRITRKR